MVMTVEVLIKEIQHKTILKTFGKIHLKLPRMQNSYYDGCFLKRKMKQTKRNHGKFM